VKYLGLAIQFLTVLPVQIRGTVTDNDLGRSMACFPLVGLVMGGVLAAAAWLMRGLPADLGAFVLLLSMTLLTGALHLDGVADSVDGLYGVRDTERRLQIMRDSCVGAMGAVGLVFVVLLKWILLKALWPAAVGPALLAALTFSRWVQAAAASASPYARSNGKAGAYMAHAPRPVVLGLVVPVAAPFFVLFGPAGLCLFALVVVAILLLRGFVMRRIGGLTGDTLGLLNEAAEVLVLMGVLLCLS